MNKILSGIFSKQITPIFLIIVVCLPFIYFFHFDVPLSSDSSWAGITLLKLLRQGLNLQTFYLIPTHGIGYLFTYYISQYFLLKIFTFQISGLMNVLNLINGIFFIANIILLYIFFRKIFCNKIFPFFLSIIYFFLPMSFQLALYANPNTFSLFFFMLANIFFISYLQNNRWQDIVLVAFFSLCAVLMRIDTIFFFTSFISLTVLLQKSIKNTIVFSVFNTIFLCVGFLTVQRVVLTKSFIKATSNDLLAYIDTFNLNLTLQALAQIVYAVGFGLLFISIFFVIHFTMSKKYRVLLSACIWIIFPALINILLSPHSHIARYMAPSFVGIVLFVGLGINSIAEKNRRLRMLMIIVAYILHFTAMPFSYYMGTKFYKLKRQYHQRERVIIEYVPIGNIFLNSYYLREEKRKAWRVARKVIEKYNKVIVFSDNTNRIPYYYLLYYLFKDIEMQGLKGATSLWAVGNKEFIFFDIFPQYDKDRLIYFISNNRYKDFSIHFPPFIPQRVPQLYKDIESFCEKNKMILIDGNNLR